MATDIVDIVTNLSFKAETTGLSEAYKELNRLIKLIAKHGEELNKLNGIKAGLDKGELELLQQTNKAHQEKMQALQQELAAMKQLVASNASLNQSIASNLSILNRLIPKENEDAEATNKDTEAKKRNKGATDEAAAAKRKLIDEESRMAKASKDTTIAMTSLNYIVQDAPYGFVGVSNNISPLVQSFRQLQASTGGAGAAIKAMLGSLIGPQGIFLAISLVTGLLVAFSDDIIAAFTGGATTVENFNEAFKETSKESAKSTAELKSLVAVVSSASTSYSDLVSAIDKINKQYPDYLGNITAEQLLTTEGNALIEEQIKLLNRRAVMQAANDAYAKSLEVVAEKQADLIRLTTEGKTAWEKFSDFFIGDLNNTIKDALDDYQESLDKAKEAEEGMIDPIEKTIEAIKKKIKITQYLIEWNEKKAVTNIDLKEELEIQNNILKTLESQLLLKKQLSQTEPLTSAEIEQKLAEAALNRAGGSDTQAAKDAAIKNEQAKYQVAIEALNKRYTEEHKIRKEDLANNKSYNAEKQLLESQLQKSIDDIRNRGTGGRKTTTAKKDPYKEALAAADYDKLYKDVNDPVLELMRSNIATAIEVDKLREESREGQIIPEEQLKVEKDHLAANLKYYEETISYRERQIELETVLKKLRIAEQFEMKEDILRYKLESKRLDQELLKAARRPEHINKTGFDNDANMKLSIQRSMESSQDVANRLLRPEEDAKRAKEEKQRRERSKKLIEESVKNIEDSIFDIMKQALERRATLLDLEVEIRRDRVNQAVVLAQQGNAEILKSEQERLNKAQKEREKIARRQIEINNIMLASSAALTMAKSLETIATAGTGGEGYTVVARVLAAVAALSAGFGAVYGMVNSYSSFKDGVVNFKGKGTGTSDENMVFISNGESVITAAGTRKYAPILEAINKDKPLPIPMTNSLYPNSFSQKQNYNSLEKRLDKLIELQSKNDISVKTMVTNGQIANIVESERRFNRLQWS